MEIRYLSIYTNLSRRVYLRGEMYQLVVVFFLDVFSSL